MVGHNLELFLPIPDLFCKKCYQRATFLWVFFLRFMKDGGGNDTFHRCPEFSNGNPPTLSPMINSLASDLSALTLFLEIPHSLSGKSELFQ